MCIFCLPDEKNGFSLHKAAGESRDKGFDKHESLWRMREGGSGEGRRGLSGERPLLPSPDSSRSSLLQSILEIRGTAPFGGHHAGPDGIGGRTDLAEQGALVGRHLALEHFTAATAGQWLGFRQGKAETGEGVEALVGRSQREAAAGDDAEAAPEGVGGAEHLRQDGPCLGVAVVVDGAGGRRSRP